jgi:glutaminyl-peptide cyclotransferase
MRFMRKCSSGHLIATARGRPFLFFFLVLTLGLTGCPSGGQRNNNSGTPQGQATPPVTNASPQTAPAAIAFDAERAFEHVRRQVEIGPRPAGSAELARTREYIVGQLKSYGLNVTSDEFSAATPAGEKRFVNVTAEIAGESNEVIMLASHYDTKPIKEFRFVGANDGASSTGALLEIARVMAANPQKPRFTYWLVFFDGEEAFCFDWDECRNPDGPDNTYGSRHYVAQLREKNELQRVRAVILLDMIGYKDLRFGRDAEMSTPWLVEVIWRTARGLGYGAQFVDTIEGVGGDDHEPFLRAGVEAVDIIQLNTYPYWHTAEDTLDKISPRSLKIVGDVMLASLPRIEQRLQSKAAP